MKWLSSSKKLDDVCRKIIENHKIFQKEADIKLEYINNPENIQVLTYKQLDNLEIALPESSTEKNDLNLARKNHEEACKKLKDFCNRPDVLNAYIEQGLGQDLPLGWRSAHIYLKSEGFQVYFATFDEQTKTINLRAENEIDPLKDAHFIIVDETTNLHFNLLLRVGEDITLEAATPTYISQQEIALRGSLSVLEQASNYSVKLENSKPKQKNIKISSKAPLPLNGISLNDLINKIKLERPTNKYQYVNSVN